MNTVPFSYPKEFHPGDSAGTTGVYRAIHLRHRMPHELTVLEGETFPACKKCGGKVKFELLHAAPRLKGDLDLMMAMSAALIAIIAVL